MKIVLLGTQSPRIERAAIYTMIGVTGYFIGRFVDVADSLTTMTLTTPLSLYAFGLAVGAACSLGLVWAHMSAMRIKLVRVDDKGIAEVMALGDDSETDEGDLQ